MFINMGHISAETILKRTTSFNWMPEMVDLPAMHGNFNGESNDKSDKPWHLGPCLKTNHIYRMYK